MVDETANSEAGAVIVANGRLLAVFPKPTRTNTAPRANHSDPLEAAYQNEWSDETRQWADTFNALQVTSDDMIRLDKTIRQGLNDGTVQYLEVSQGVDGVKAIVAPIDDAAENELGFIGAVYWMDS